MNIFKIIIKKYKERKEFFKRKEETVKLLELFSKNSLNLLKCLKEERVMFSTIYELCRFRIDDVERLLMFTGYSNKYFVIEKTSDSNEVIVKSKITFDFSFSESDLYSYIADKIAIEYMIAYLYSGSKFANMYRDGSLFIK